MGKEKKCGCGVQTQDLAGHMRAAALAYLTERNGTSLIRLAAQGVASQHGGAARQLLLESDHCLRLQISGDELSFVFRAGQGSLPLAGFPSCGCKFKGSPEAISKHVFKAAQSILSSRKLGGLLLMALGGTHGKLGVDTLRNETFGVDLSTAVLKWDKVENRMFHPKMKAAKNAVELAATSKAGKAQQKPAASAPAPAAPHKQTLDKEDATSLLELLGQPEDPRRVAVDLEGDLREGGEIQLMQVGWIQGSRRRSALLDMLEVHTFLPALKTFLESEAVVKVFHDSRADRLALKAILGIELAGVRDTSCMSDLAFLTRHGEAQVAKQGLNTLLRRAGLPVNTAKDGFCHDSETGESIWRTRPLTEKMARYASEDVLYLLELHDWLEKDLLKAQREAVEKGSREFVDGGRQDPGVVTGVVEPLRFSPAAEAFISRLEIGLDDDEFLNSFLALFPDEISYLINAETGDDYLQEVAIDEGREIALRFDSASGREQAFLQHEATEEDVDGLLDLLKNGEEVPWTSDNRYCMPGTLHRVCRLLNTADNATIGLTYRLGRHVGDSNRLLGDLVHRVAESLGQRNKRPVSVLLLGPPGAGKTTILRQMAALLGETFGRQTAVVDTSLEIAGGGRTPHPCIGRARRFQVEKRDQQHAVLVEVVQNHSPKVIIVDEIGTPKEAHAVRSISQRGVAMVATAHGKTLGDLMKNPDLVRLVGGIQAVTLGAGEVRERKASQKTVQERAGAPCFQVLVEIISFTELFIIENVAKAVDDSLRSSPVIRERRWVDPSGTVQRCFTTNRDGTEH